MDAVVVLVADADLVDRVGFIRDHLASKPVGVLRPVDFDLRAAHVTGGVGGSTRAWPQNDLRGKLGHPGTKIVLGIAHLDVVVVTFLSIKPNNSI